MFFHRNPAPQFLNVKFLNQRTGCEQHLLESGECTEHNSPSGPLNKEAAVLLADQKQAFERLSIRWFKRVLDGWQFPLWARRSFMAFVESRSVTAAGQIGVLRRLLRSIGIMGGTASPLSWGIAYDPIVEGMFRAIGVEAPTYVDVLAGLINGPAQAMRAAHYLIWASWAAGLEVSTHTCCRLTYAPDSHELALPAQGSRSRRGSVTTDAGTLPVSLLQSCVPSSQKSGLQGGISLSRPTLVARVPSRPLSSPTENTRDGAPS